MSPPVGAPGQLRNPKGGFIEPQTESRKRNSPAASVQPLAYAILLRRGFGGALVSLPAHLIAVPAIVAHELEALVRDVLGYRGDEVARREAVHGFSKSPPRLWGLPSPSPSAPCPIPMQHTVAGVPASGQGVPLTLPDPQHRGRKEPPLAPHGLR